MGSPKGFDALLPKARSQDARGFEITAVASACFIKNRAKFQNRDQFKSRLSAISSPTTTVVSSAPATSSPATSTHGLELRRHFLLGFTK